MTRGMDLDPRDGSERNIHALLKARPHVLVRRRADSAWVTTKQAVERLYAWANFCVNQGFPEEQALRRIVES